MNISLDQYVEIVGEEVIDQLHQLARHLKDRKVVHVNSTREGGGVAEILHRLIPLKRELGIDAQWEVIEGNDIFYQCTKSFHNALQGDRVGVTPEQLEAYEHVNQENAERLRETLSTADVVFIHDPQPAPLMNLIPERSGKWVWRCHIDVSHPYRPIWRYLHRHVAGYDASIWSLAAFARPLPHSTYLIPPSIDPISEKNRELDNETIEAVRKRFDIDPDRPLITQVSRYDRFKDPVGVIEAYKQVKRYVPLQLVLVGGGATDDPEGEAVLKEVHEAAGEDPDIKVLVLAPDAHTEINALQRLSDIVLQKSTKEGFGLTVTEAMWKGKPVIGGDTGGIRLQVVDHHTGFLVNTPEGAAFRVRYLLKHRDALESMGANARQYVLENFLLTRHLREYLALMVAMIHGTDGRIEL